VPDGEASLTAGPLTAPVKVPPLIGIALSANVPCAAVA